MDQLRQAIGWLKRQHFWVLSVLVALIAMYCWWSAAGKLSKEYEQNQTQIKAEFSNIQNIRNDPFHPNEDVKEKQEAERIKQAEHVAALWQQLYDRQRGDVLVWPTQLKKEFINYVEKHSFGDDIPPDLRENYQNYAKRHFPELPKKVEARLMREGEAGGAGASGFSRTRSYSPEGGAGPGAAGAGELEEDEAFICEWLDQGIVREQLNFQQEPSPMVIWVTQEDLWVYHTLLKVIANTNQAAGASRMSNAAVRVIYSLEVGQRAGQFSRTPGRVYLPPSVSSPGAVLGEGDPTAAAGPESDPTAGRGEYGPGGFGAEGPGGGEQTPEQLLSGRYIDPEGKPIAVGAAGGDPSAAADPSMQTDPAAATAAPIDVTTFGKEYKRLPVRMALQMDQRWLPRLITECANQPLQVEVQEVRINPPDIGGSGGAGLGGGRRGEGGGPGGSGSMFQERNGLQMFPAQPNLIDVVVQGVIYIFNKPTQDALATDQPMAATQ